MTWSEHVSRLADEARSGEARAESYRAQQLGFAPVLVHAVRLALRDGTVDAEARAALARLATLALAGFGALPDAPGTDAALLMLLAQRQARALSWGRRRTLARLLADLGAAAAPPPAGDGAIRRLLRPYPLIGWRPADRLAG